MINEDAKPPKRITEDQYDKLMRKLWETEQRIVASEKASLNAVDNDMLYDKQRDIEKRLQRIEDALFIHAALKILQTSNCNLLKLQNGNG